MSIFKKINNTIADYEKRINDCKETSSPTPESEEWIWVEGYKATDKDMKCRDFQYELGIQYDIPDGQEIKACKNGFHLCLLLPDVYNYYTVGYGNRFFKVKALVRKTDKLEYRRVISIGNYYGGDINNKLAAKSIIFLSELTADEILKGTEAQNLPEDYKKMALETSIKTAVDEYSIHTLLEDGFSKPFAAHIVKVNKFDVAHAFGSQKDLSMDMKVLGILYHV